MAQNSGIMGTVKSYIPGMNTEEHHKKTSAEDHETHDASDTYQDQNATQGQTNQGSEGGILSYIPGFGGGSSTNNQATGVDTDTTAAGGVDGSAPHTRSGTVYGKTDDDDNSVPHGTSETGNYVGGNKHGTGRDTDVDTDTGYGAGKDYISNDGGYGGNTGTGSEYGNTGTAMGGSSHRPSTGGQQNDGTGTYTGTGTGYKSSGQGTHGHDSSAHNRGSDGTSYGGSETDYGKPSGGSAYGGSGSDYFGGKPTGGSAYTGSGSAYRGNNPTSGSAYDGSGSYGGNVPTGGSAYGGNNPADGSGYGSGSAYGGSGARGQPSAGGDGSSRNTAGGGDCDNNQTATNDGVKGTPIEGDNVKGYAVSAPVGTGDVSKLNLGGDPSGQVSGAHMEYGPTGTDSRDATGRGTVDNTTGEGDSSFANVKRNTGSGTEHVVAQSSSSRIQHSSVTQM